MISIYQAISLKRQELNRLIETKGVSDKAVLQASRELDKLIAESMKPKEEGICHDTVP